MPELPEVETMCRGIRKIERLKIAKVFLPECLYRPISITPGIGQIQRALLGQRVDSITRLGKRVAINIGDHALFFQPKMTGLVSLESVPDPDHVRFEMHFKGRRSERLQFWDRRGLGTVAMFKQADIQQQLIDGKLGPDALVIEFSDFAQRLGKTRRPIKPALLDQKLVAGVGNLYASEMLHVARIAPQKPANTISKQKLRRLHEVMLEILNAAIEHEGSTLSDGTYRTAVNDPGSYQNHHLVYDCEGKVCATCQRETVLRIVQSQRATFYCPRCQK